MAGGSTRRDLYLQVSGTTDPLQRALKSGKGILADFGSNVEAQLKAIEQNFQQLGGSNIEASARSLEANYRRAFTGIKQAANDALALPKTDVGAINLDVPSAQRAAAAAEAEAMALREIAEAAGRAAIATNNGASAESVYAKSALSAALAAEENATALRTQATALESVQNELNAAGRSTVETVDRHRQLTASSGMVRSGMQQLSFQLGDVAQGFAAGTPVMTIFAQQSGQVIQAISLMSGEAKGFLGFLGGPWGQVLTAALVVLSPLVAKMFEAHDASIQAKIGADGLSDAQGVLGKMFDLTSGKLEHQNELLRLNARLTAINLRAEAEQAAQSAKNIFNRAGSESVTGVVGSFFSRTGGGPLQRQSLMNARADEQKRYIDAIQNAKSDDARSKASEAALRFSEKANFDGLTIDKSQFQQAIIDAATATVKKKTADLLDTTMDTGKLDAAFKRDTKPKKAKVDHSAEQAANKDRAYQGELDKAQSDYAKAQLALSDTAEARLQIELDDLRSGQVQRDLQIDDEVKAKKITEAQAKILKDINARTEALEEIAATNKKEAALINEQFDRERAGFEATDALLRLNEEMATTRSERLKIERQLLDHAQQQRRDEIANTIKNPTASAADKEKAVIAAQNLPNIEAGEDKNLSKRFASPLEAYKTQLHEATDDMNDALQGVAVHGLQSIEDGLTGVLMGTKSLKSAFKEMAASIIADLIKIGIEKAIVAAIGNSGFFSFLGPGASTGMVPGKADGMVPGFAGGGASLVDGMIRGAGTGRSDSILALLGNGRPIRVSNGESIVTAAATKRFWPYIKAMNDNHLDVFADGGISVPTHMADFSRDDIGAIREGRRARAGDVTNHFDLRGAMVDRDVYADMQRIANETIEQQTPAIVGQSVIATRDFQQRRFF